MVKAALIGAYVTAGFLTFGHVFNQNYVAPTHVVDCGVKPDILKDFNANTAWHECRLRNIDAKYSGTSSAESSVPALLAGIAWPAYWAGHFAIEVTK